MGTIIGLAILCLLVGPALFSVIRNRKNGKECGCSQGCSRCGHCH